MAIEFTPKEYRMTQYLTDRDAIRLWAEARGGNPVLLEMPDGTGTRTVLQLTFGQDSLNAEGNEGPDRVDGYRLVDWTEWLDALEANGLALAVSDDPSGGNEAEYTFVPR
jgi:hypothetical protein